jgi:hypothetical protein
MTEPTLRDIHNHLDGLAVDGGRYAIMCARTGEHPVPISGLRFVNRETAARAARIAQHYRARLRRYDSRLPYHDLIVCEDAVSVHGSADRVETDWHREFWTVAVRELARFRVICEGKQ